MNKYVILNSTGWYASKILKDYPEYQGIDRLVWPLSEEDKKSVINLQNEEKKLAELYIHEMSDYMLNNNSVFCYNEKYVLQYMSLCELLGVEADLFICKNGIDIVEEKKRLIVNNREYIFVGYDYVLKDSTYSCLIHEKHLIDNLEKIQLNSSGLLDNLEDARKFAELREIAKKKNAGIGFELGSGGVDFFALAMFRYQC